MTNAARADWSRSRKLERPDVAPSEPGRLLRDLRVGAGLTQHRLAARAGVHASTVSLIEHGRCRASRNVLRRLWLAAHGDAQDLDRLLAASGLLPDSVVAAGGWDAYVRIWRGQARMLERKLACRDAYIAEQARRLVALLEQLREVRDARCGR